MHIDRLAEEEGFEPPRPLRPTRFRIVRFQPLSHSSLSDGILERGENVVTSFPAGKSFCATIPPGIGFVASRHAAVPAQDAQVVRQDSGRVVGCSCGEDAVIGGYRCAYISEELHCVNIQEAVDSHVWVEIWMRDRGEPDLLQKGSGVLLLATCFILTGCVWMRDLPYHDQRRAADLAFENQEYMLAASRYESLTDRYPPDSSIREEMMFRQGVALYSVGTYHSARYVFGEYLSEYPRGIHQTDIKDYIRKIDVLMSRATPAEAMKLQEAKTKANLDALNILLAEHPTDWRVFEAIGDAQWKLGNYDEAIEAYFKAHSIASTYEERDLNNGKLILDADGNPIPVNPKVLEQMEIDRNPVRVYDLSVYNSRRDSIFSGGEMRFYNLTGSVRNQGRQLLNGVEVEVVYKDISGNILDVDYVNIGSLGPGEVRAFLSRADEFDNIYNIVDYDVRVHWRK